MVKDVERWDGQVIIAPRIVKLDGHHWRRGPDSAYIGFRFELEWFVEGESARGKSPMSRSRQADLL